MRIETEYSVGDVVRFKTYVGEERVGVILRVIVEEVWIGYYISYGDTDDEVHEGDILFKYVKEDK